MKKYVIFFTLFIISFNVIAADRYRGSISGKIVESNGHVFVGGAGFTDGVYFKGKDTINFRQERGQKVRLSKEGFLTSNEINNKYHMIAKILNRKDDAFKMSITAYHNFLVFNASGKSTLKSTKLFDKMIKGQLNSKNSYQIIEDGKANFYVDINIDKVFSTEELKLLHSQGKWPTSN